MIQFENISFSYAGNAKDGLVNINLTIADGECILLCGRSGCGKTTFTRIINGLIPNFFPGKLRGQILINDIELSKIPMYKISEQVGSIFQNPRTQFFNADTDSEIAFGIENAGIPSDELHRRVIQTVKDLNIENLSARNLFELSGGEKQKIAFASVYAMNPNIYILDEPSSNLDIDAIAELKKMLLLLKHQGKTILVAEHRLYYLIDVIDRALYFEDGRLAGTYSPQELCTLPQTTRESLGLRATDLRTVRPAIPFSNQCDTVLELKDITLYYKRRMVLKNLYLSAMAGKVMGIMGHNGAGKSTLLRTICGLHKEMKGQILLNGIPRNRDYLMKHSYLVMQDVNYELFAETVEKECILGIKDPDMALAETILEELDLAPFRKWHPNTLSGGQKQRLAVAVSMICEKKILIFDEPTSGLDYDNMLRVATLITRLAQMGKIIFVATHDYEFVCQTCNSLIYIDNREKKEDFPICQKNDVYLQQLCGIAGNFDKKIC